jgi:hypothetical protein
VRFLPHIIKHTLEGRFIYLLVTILIFIGVGPILADMTRFRLLLDIFFSAILLSAIYAVSQKKRDTVIAFALAIPTLLAFWLRDFTSGVAFNVTSEIFGSLFFGYTIIVLLNFILKSPKITRHVIHAALIGYLLMGLMWASIYELIDTIHPGSFSLAQGWIDNPRLIYLYFSYVTLTTLGYGDMTPLTAQAYSISILEAIIGQIYITVLIARLVGMHISDSGKDRQSGPDQ